MFGYHSHSLVWSVVQGNLPWYKVSLKVGVYMGKKRLLYEKAYRGLGNKPLVYEKEALVFEEGALGVTPLPSVTFSASFSIAQLASSSTCHITGHRHHLVVACLTVMSCNPFFNSHTRAAARRSTPQHVGLDIADVAVHLACTARALQQPFVCRRCAHPWQLAAQPQQPCRTPCDTAGRWRRPQQQRWLRLAPASVPPALPHQWKRGVPIKHGPQPACWRCGITTPRMHNRRPNAGRLSAALGGRGALSCRSGRARGGLWHREACSVTEAAAWTTATCDAVVRPARQQHHR